MASIISNFKKNPRLFRRVINFWPAFMGAGIVVEQIADNYLFVQVSLRDRFYNRNLVGTHFGGSIFALVDPWYMLMLINALGPKYYVWDLSASIQFKQPGKGRLTAQMELCTDVIAQIHERAQAGARVEWDFQASINDAAGEEIAEVSKKIYIRLKPQYRG